MPILRLTDRVKKVLQSEMHSDNATIDRRADLDPEGRSELDSRGVHWQAGYVQSRKQWIRYEKSIAEGTDSQRLDEYAGSDHKCSNGLEPSRNQF